jgi:hypothetical protein
MSVVVPEDFDYSASISFLEIRDQLPAIDPESLGVQDVLAILLHLFHQKPGFEDRGHDLNNTETAWVNAYLFRLRPARVDQGQEGYVVECIGSSVDRMAELL